MGRISRVYMRCVRSVEFDFLEKELTMTKKCGKDKGQTQAQGIWARVYAKYVKRIKGEKLHRAENAGAIER